jgi:hypothetical protein
MNLFVELSAWLAGRIGDAIFPPEPTLIISYLTPQEIMTRDRIKSIQSKIGVEVDGFWGPKSIAACQSYLRSLMPAESNWPRPSQESLQGFYGSPGDESRLVSVNVEGLGLRYDGKPVKSIRCHDKVADSLKRALESLAKSHPDILAQYAGVYNNRTMRGGSLPSLHARGAAIDLAADTNRLSQSWPVSATMPLEVMEAFAREGWVAAGAFWGRDAMHFQATQ